MANLKGIVLAGGKGTRLYPLTKGVSKQLLPVYKYPMIFFPLNTLFELGIKDVLVITTAEQQELFKQTLRDVSCMNLSYAVQDEPRGLAEAFIIAQEFLDGSDAALVLGDNIVLNNEPLRAEPNTIFSYKVREPQRYGVVKKDENGKIQSIVEKPQSFVSDEAVIGLYILENRACEIAKTLKPSRRNELEIVDLIKTLDDSGGNVRVHVLDGFWFDAGTHDDLLDCSNLVKAIEYRTNKTYDLA